MLFAWLRRRRRRAILQTPLPAEWDAILESVPHIVALPAELRSRHRDAVRLFLGEKTFEGCRGFELDDRIRVVIAGLACVLVLGMDDYVFDNVSTVLVYPDAFAVPNRVDIGSEVALEEESERLGEAHYRGPVILTWDEIAEDIRDPGFGRNLVFHEFAHQLDMLNGDVDGVPILPDELQEPWAKIMHREYRQLQKQTRRRRDTLIDAYGASEPAEFFAVITETFFDASVELRVEKPELYQLLSQYYRLDPAAWPRQRGET